jgi:hypothetical protein
MATIPAIAGKNPLWKVGVFSINPESSLLL